MKLLILAPYPLDEAPSQRFRFELFLKSMEQNNIKWNFQPFVFAHQWQILYQNGKSVDKVIAVTNGLFRRIRILFFAKNYDYILIHRETTPFGPPLFEWIIAKILRKKIIYDFDDAIWMPDQKDEPAFWKWLKWRSKVKSICKWSYKVSVGNEYLADFARQYCDRVEVIPTMVDIEVHTPLLTLRQAQDDKGQAQDDKGHARDDKGHAQDDKGHARDDKGHAPSVARGLPTAQQDDKGLQGQDKQDETKENPKPKTQNPKPIIGWTGSHSTLFYLEMILPVLQELEKTHSFTFLVIANKNPELPLKNFKFLPWKKETEIDDLSQIDIGIMPLEDSEWSKGKCGFKLIQYLALEIPAVASPVGVNPHIIEDDKTGFLASTPAEWKNKLIVLLENESLRKQLGKAGRKLIQSNYSVESQRAQFLNLFS